MKVKDLLKFEVQAHKKKLPRDIRQLIFIEDKDLEKHLIHYIRTNKKYTKYPLNIINQNSIKETCWTTDRFYGSYVANSK